MNLSFSTFLNSIKVIIIFSVFGNMIKILYSNVFRFGYTNQNFSNIMLIIFWGNILICKEAFSQKVDQQY